MGPLWQLFTVLLLNEPADGHEGPHLAGYARCLFSFVWAMESLFREGGGAKRSASAANRLTPIQSSMPYVFIF